LLFQINFKFKEPQENGTWKKTDGNALDTLEQEAK